MPKQPLGELRSLPDIIYFAEKSIFGPAFQVPWIPIFLGSFFLGAIPFGRVISQWVARIDITQRGSGNIGATNVARELGLGWGILTLVLDLLKGFIPVFLANVFSPGAVLELAITGLCALLGHQFSPFLRFRGGKGVATLLGVFLAISPLSCLGALVVFVLTASIFDFISLGSMAAAWTIPFLLALLGMPLSVVLTSISAAFLICYKHTDNIRRLVQGNERRWRKRQIRTEDRETDRSQHPNINSLLNFTQDRTLNLRNLTKRARTYYESNKYHLLEKLPLCVFLVYAKTIESRVDNKWEAPIIAGGLLAILSLIILAINRTHFNRIFLGINMYLITAAGAIFFHLNWIERIYEKLTVSAVLVWVIIIGIVTMVFSHGGFLGIYQRDRASIVQGSFYLLVAAAAALALSMVFHDNTVLSEFVPFVLLFASQHVLRLKYMREETGSELD
jgi:glycerol-3-phosphate acyltransferase PlsY